MTAARLKQPPDQGEHREAWNLLRGSYDSDANTRARPPALMPGISKADRGAGRPPIELSRGCWLAQHPLQAERADERAFGPETWHWSQHERWRGGCGHTTCSNPERATELRHMLRLGSRYAGHVPD